MSLGESGVRDASAERLEVSDPLDEAVREQTLRTVEAFLRGGVVGVLFGRVFEAGEVQRDVEVVDLRGAFLLPACGGGSALLARAEDDLEVLGRGVLLFFACVEVWLFFVAAAVVVFFFCVVLLVVAEDGCLDFFGEHCDFSADGALDFLEVDLVLVLGVEEDLHSAGDVDVVAAVEADDAVGDASADVALALGLGVFVVCRELLFVFGLIPRISPLIH